MKVRVTVTLDIDPDAWESNYGVSGASAIREDVRSWAFHLLHDAADETGNLITGRKTYNPNEALGGVAQ